MRTKLASAAAVVTLVAGIALWVLYGNRPLDDSQLLDGIRHSDLAVIQDYLARGGSPERVIDVRGKPMSLLQAAIADREEAIALALIDAGAELESSGVDLVTVGTNGLTRVAETQLPLPADHEIAYTGLGAAASNGYYDVVEAYLRHPDGRTAEWAGEYGLAVNVAMAAGYDDTARLLLAAGADLTETLHTATRYSSPGMVRDLLARGEDPVGRIVISGVREQTPIEFAWTRYREDMAYREWRAQTGMPPLHQNTDAQYVLFELLRVGARLDDVDLSTIARDGLEELAALGTTADKLLGAARIGLFEEVQELLGSQTYDFETLRSAVVEALRNDHDDIARLLLQRGAPVNGGVLHVAASSSSPGMVRYLLSNGADPSERVGDSTPLESWLADRATNDPEFNLHELIVGGADACWLVSRRAELPGLSAMVLRDSAPNCWDNLD